MGRLTANSNPLHASVNYRNEVPHYIPRWKFNISITLDTPGKEI